MHVNTGQARDSASSRSRATVLGPAIAIPVFVALVAMAAAIFYFMRRRHKGISGYKWRFFGENSSWRLKLPVPVAPPTLNLWKNAASELA